LPFPLQEGRRNNLSLSFLSLRGGEGRKSLCLHSLHCTISLPSSADEKRGRGADSFSPPSCPGSGRGRGKEDLSRALTLDALKGRPSIESRGRFQEGEKKIGLAAVLQAGRRTLLTLKKEGRRLGLATRHSGDCGRGRDVPFTCGPRPEGGTRIAALKGEKEEGRGASLTPAGVKETNISLKGKNPVPEGKKKGGGLRAVHVGKGEKLFSSSQSLPLLSMAGKKGKSRGEPAFVAKGRGELSLVDGRGPGPSSEYLPGGKKRGGGRQSAPHYILFVKRPLLY